jgi:hypothetical protein
MLNMRMAEMIASGEAIDVSDFERTPEGYYIFPYDLYGMDTDDKDFCDAKREMWIWSIGRDRRTGQRFASTSSVFYPSNEKFECVWLR